VSVKRWKLGWKRCDCVKCEAALTIEQTEEDCGWVRWGDHKDEVARLKSEVDALKLGSLLTAVDVLQFINLKAEVERLTAEVSYDNRVQLHVDKLAAEFTQSEVERLKAEVERLTERNKFLEQIDSYIQGANENAYEKRCDELEAEVERLTEGNECLNAFHDKEMERSAYLLEEFNRTTAWGRGLESDLSHARVEISFLKADVERLHKAGDAMASALILFEMKSEEERQDRIKAWSAAKEGKQS